MAYDCHIIVDFEFNPVAKENRDLLFQEIIQIGAVKLNGNYEEIGRFSCYVKPELNTCVEGQITNLTGIRTEDVMEALDFASALEVFSKWAGPAPCRVYSWSYSDLDQLDKECWVKGMPFPENLTRWMNFQRVWQRIIHYPARMQMALKFAVKQAGIPYDERRAHGALYDAEITAELLRLTRNRHYLDNLAAAKTLVTTCVEHSSYSIGSTCGDKLAALMARLECA